ncbi:hypothetical protein K438DRAFT_2132943, partial [Mycena galopus ATCC 62051]
MEASATPSLTPSLASLLKPASSISGDQSARLDRTSGSSASALLQGHGVLDTESVSQFLGHKREHRIFISACADSDIRDEGLSASLQKFHPVYDPLRDDDPLLSYGAVDGLLPGKTAEETMVLRDIIMRWVQPHINLNWETLEEGIQKFKEEKPSKHSLLVFKHHERITYSIGSFLLERFAHLVLAASQILEGLNEFLGNPPKKCFLLDPEWKFLRTMELDTSRTVILMAFATLQLRLSNTGLHIRKFLQTVQRMYGQVPPDLVSVLSTRSSVRSEFGQEAPRVELAKLLSRPDYGAVADTIHAEARARLVEDANLPPRDVFYRDSPRAAEAHHVALPASP